MKCSIKGCHKKVHAQSLCNAHYHRGWRRRTLRIKTQAEMFKDKLIDFLDIQILCGYVSRSLWIGYKTDRSQVAANGQWGRFLKKLKKEKEVHCIKGEPPYGENHYQLKETLDDLL